MPIVEPSRATARPAAQQQDIPIVDPIRPWRETAARLPGRGARIVRARARRELARQALLDTIYGRVHEHQ
jgi:hypothetical protein